MYLHNARGFYGAVPMSLSGDMDVHPLLGDPALARRRSQPNPAALSRASPLCALRSFADFADQIIHAGADLVTGVFFGDLKHRSGSIEFVVG